MPLGIHLLKAAQQVPPQAPGCLDLAVYRLRDRLALGMDLGSFLASELASHAGIEGILRHRSQSRLRRLAVRQSADGDVGVNFPGRGGGSGQLPRGSAALNGAARQGMANSPSRAAAGGDAISRKGDSNRGKAQSCRDTK
jgi:hypothetical protein